MSEQELVHTSCHFCQKGKLVIVMSRIVGVDIYICLACLTTALDVFREELRLAAE